MAIGSYWADDYVEKKKSVQEAIGLIRSGQRIFIGSYCGEPQCLVRGLAEVAQRFSNIEIIRLMSQETTPLYLIANKTQDQSLGIRSFYLGSASSGALARNMRFYTPVNHVRDTPALHQQKDPPRCGPGPGQPAG